MRRAPLLAAFGLFLLVSVPAIAVPTTITPLDTPTCDTLAAPTAVDELGLAAAFPIGEQISAFAGVTTTTACATVPDNALLTNVTVNMTNLNTIAFSSVWYVANPGTVITNIDGTITGMPAFQIDTAGVHAPLIAESGAADGIFSPGESWTFILQDYTNALLGAAALGAIGVPDTGLPPVASGSIVAVPVPEPGTVTLVALGVAALASRRRAQVTARSRVI